VADIRRCGSAALDLADVASGRIDAFYENDLAPWDWAAGALLAAEAGAFVAELFRRYRPFNPIAVWPAAVSPFGVAHRSGVPGEWP
jgi:fructose-1,6-bisphosphatase/inositol monophosphatase family enzyme